MKQYAFKIYPIIVNGYMQGEESNSCQVYAECGKKQYK